MYPVTSGVLKHHDKGESLPQGAILLSPQEALKYQWQIMETWRKNKQSWPVHYGYMALGVVGAAAAASVTNFYRRQLKMKTYARFSCYAPATFFTGLFASIVHKAYVTNDILLAKTPCQTCLDLRAASIQVLVGLAYPVAVTSIITFSFASAYQTCLIPSLINEYSQLFQLWRKITQSGLRKFAIVASLQVIAAFGITQLESFSFHDIMRKAEEKSQVVNDP